MSKTEAAPEEAPRKANRSPAGEPAEAAAQQRAADERDLGAAGSQLSTAPTEDLSSGPVGIGVLGWVRWFWRQLTSMRVALVLLLLLSLGSIPGSLIPQTNVDELKVADFQKRHDTISPIYEKLGMFHVYSSVWFSAIYILLFVSSSAASSRAPGSSSASCAAARRARPGC